MSGDDELWSELSQALGQRPGWSVQDSPTPGVGPNWSFAPRGKVDFSVFIDNGRIYLNEEKTDREIQFEAVETLTTALDANPATAVRPGQGETRQPFMRWR